MRQAGAGFVRHLDRADSVRPKHGLRRAHHLFEDELQRTFLQCQFQQRVLEALNLVAVRGILRISLRTGGGLGWAHHGAQHAGPVARTVRHRGQNHVLRRAIGGQGHR